MNVVINSPDTGLTEMMKAAHSGKRFCSDQTEAAMTSWREILKTPHPMDVFTDEEILSCKVGYKPTINGIPWEQINEAQKVEIGRHALEGMIKNLQMRIPVSVI